MLRASNAPALFRPMAANSLYASQMRFFASEDKPRTEFYKVATKPKTEYRFGRTEENEMRGK